MSETTKVISDIDKLFTEIEINGETFKSENYVPQDSEAKVIKAQKTEETNITPQTEEDDTPKEPVLLTKEINDLDLLFSAIEINGEVYKSDKYTPPIPKASVIKAPPKEPDKPTVEIISEPVIGQTVQAVNLNGTIHDFEDIEAMQTAESASQTANQASQSVSSIQNLVPSQASASNKLADKDFVNSSIATNTSNFIGTFNTLEELESQTATNNDYAFWKTTDSDGNILFKRYKYVADDGTWQFEYDLNNSSFTAEQWATINSGLTEESVANKLDIDGENGTSEGVSVLLNKLTEGTSDPTDNDYYISQWAGGGTTYTTYHRRPVKALWNYIKGKISSVLGLTSTNYGGKSATAGTADTANSVAWNNVSGKPTLFTATTSFSSDKNYVKFSNGMLIQWGIVDGGSEVQDRTYTITFPTKFTVKPTISATPVRDSGNIGWMSDGARNLTVNGFEVRFRGDSSNEKTRYCSWIAIGR